MYILILIVFILLIIFIVIELVWHFIPKYIGLGNKHMFLLWDSVNKTERLNAWKENPEWTNIIHPKFKEHMDKVIPEVCRKRLKNIMSFSGFQIWNPFQFVWKNLRSWKNFWNEVRSAYKESMLVGINEAAKINPEWLEIYDVKDHPIVFHLRCSDVPLTGHSQYHLPTKESLRWSINYVKTLNIDVSNILILSCSDHLSEKCSKETCSNIVKFYSDFLKDEMNIKKVETQCSSLEKDFRTMMRAPILIMSGSSLAFSAGLAGVASKIIFLSPDYENYNYGCDNVLEKDIVIIPPIENRIIKHSEILNYCDYKSVIETINLIN